MNIPNLGRPTWAEIDLDALRWNFLQAKRLVGKQHPILAVVKANAYGHGAVACARALTAAGAEELGVASLEEAEELRRHDLRQPLVVFGLIQSYEAPAAVHWSVQPTVVLAEQCRALARAARNRRAPAAVHLKIDTGMGRIGIAPGETQAFLAQLQKHPELRLAGIFTHFAHADGRDRKGLQQQMQGLLSAADCARSLGFNKFKLHAANSAAVMDAPETHADMVRPGLMLYGLHPAPRFQKKVSLRPVLSWKTRIVQIKQVERGTGLSYGHTFVTRKRSRIATLPVGYADGFSRAFSNQGKVLIRGTACPIVGRVCMDMCLADVTQVRNAGLGDEVTLIGQQGHARISADDLARMLNTISYEVLCGIGSRVPRIYRGAKP